MQGHTIVRRQQAHEQQSVRCCPCMPALTIIQLAGCTPTIPFDLAWAACTERAASPCHAGVGAAAGGATMSSDGPPPAHATDPISAPPPSPTERSTNDQTSMKRQSSQRMHQHHKPTAKRLTTSCRIALPPRVTGPTLMAAGDKKVAPERASDNDDSTAFYSGCLDEHERRVGYSSLSNKLLSTQ